MTFIETNLSGVYVVECDVFADERGSFARAWMPDEFAAKGLATEIAQASLAFTKHRGTIRGLHFQRAPFEQVKLVRVTRGGIFDVAVDLRPGSPTYCQWFGVELTAENRRMLYVPFGLAHGYQTLVDETEIFYFISAPYSRDHESGVRWDDPAFAVVWPLGSPTVIHPRDASYADFKGT